ncbi:MAG: helix-hairpin-helix domain-containing protein [Methanomassiliicoccaceae archaeon]|nr:helix-hairpin-helix domain-containing protein [Methanomassiliicoccaceae archaeon]
MNEEDEVIARLRVIPSVSEKCARGLYLLGMREVDDLKGKDPTDLYARLKERKDFFAEPCMQNMIRIAVGFANKGMENIAKIKRS